MSRHLEARDFAYAISLVPKKDLVFSDIKVFDEAQAARGSILQYRTKAAKTSDQAYG